jgi:protoheme IX farnesyltransferase
LALYKQSDYGAAGIPMMPNVAGEASTKLQILLYSALLVASTLAPGALGFAGLPYLSVAAVAGLWFMLLAARLFRAEGVPLRKAGKTLFAYSLYYLAIIFLALLADNLLTRLGAL